MIRMPRACACATSSEKSGSVPNSGRTAHVVADVVAAVAQRGGVERRQPEAVDAEPLDVVELGDQAVEVARARAVGVGEGADEDLVEDGLAVPVRVVLQTGTGEVEAWHLEPPRRDGARGQG